MCFCSCLRKEWASSWLFKITSTPNGQIIHSALGNRSELASTGKTEHPRNVMQWHRWSGICDPSWLNRGSQARTPTSNLRPQPGGRPWEEKPPRFLGFGEVGLGEKQGTPISLMRPWKSCVWGAGNRWHFLLGVNSFQYWSPFVKTMHYKISFIYKKG